MKRRGIFWALLSLLLAAAAVVLLAAWWRQEVAAARNAEAVLHRVEQSVFVQAEPEEQEENVVSGVLEIPALTLRLAVAQEWSESMLEKTPCRYSGGAETGNLVIAGHNYAAHFGRLRQLKPGQTVVFTDEQGCRREYRVDETEILQPWQVEEMVNGKWELTLFTCTPGGEQRFTLRCREMDGTEER